MLTQRVDLFDSTYGHFTEDVLATTRRETFGQDIGQNSWLQRVLRPGRRAAGDQ
jgi:hypothetical protein